MGANLRHKTKQIEFRKRNIKIVFRIGGELEFISSQNKSQFLTGCLYIELQLLCREHGETMKKVKIRKIEHQ